MENNILLLEFSILFFIIGALFSLVLGLYSNKLGIYTSSIFAIIAALFSLLSSVNVLLHKNSFKIELPINIPLLTPILSVDPFSAFFIFLISLISISVSIFSIGYLKSESTKTSIPLLVFLYNLFLLSMILLVSANDALLFLIFWESMTLISYGLIISNTSSDESRSAGFIYLLMTHIGSAFLLFLFLIMANYSGSFSFESFHGVYKKMPDNLNLLLFIFALIGFGTKAGLIPLHIWLPEAHPAAPSHISALMSGVMIKTAIYGLLRVTFEFLNPNSYWWGVCLLLVAVSTALVGIIYASQENDIKRLLAYSSIENIGIIFIPISTGIIFYSLRLYDLAAISLVISLFHTLNHSIFKSLLFMASGSVISTTHTRSFSKLGGLIKKMPKTSLFFLIGVLAICAFPPLNGFASEWLIFQNLLALFNTSSNVIKTIGIISASLLGLTGAICIATFIKLFSGIFMAMPRTHLVEYAQESSKSMIFSLFISSSLCLLIGLFPLFTISLICPAASTLINLSQVNSAAFSNNQILHINNTVSGHYSPTLILLLLLSFSFLGFIIPKLVNNKTTTRKDETWSCGISPKAEFEYTPTGFIQPIEVIFSGLHIPKDFYYKWIYLPIYDVLNKFSYKVKTVQSGVVQVYLTYIFIALVISIIWVSL
jgi:hydrogenase-4 component B